MTTARITETLQNSSNCNDFTVATKTSNAEKHIAVWSSTATTLLLRLYESNMRLMETPKRKKYIWIAISENLKEYNIHMSPDQVRWKINSLNKKYKHCLETGLSNTFKYFTEIDHINSHYNINSCDYTLSEIVDSKCNYLHHPQTKPTVNTESKTIIGLRKMRLANRLEADKFQSKIRMEKQWLEYLRREEHLQTQRDHVLDRSFDIKEQELEMQKKYLEIKHTLELQYIHLQEKQFNNSLDAEKEKNELLKQIIN